MGQGGTRALLLVMPCVCGKCQPYPAVKMLLIQPPIELHDGGGYKLNLDSEPEYIGELVMN
jgi:hypothetical protein